MLKLVITGETPAKKNSVKFSTKTHRTYKTARFREWHEKAKAEVMAQLGNYKTPGEDYECQIIIYFVHGDLRRRDSDNGTSSIFDLLTDCGVIPDDKWTIVKEHHIFNY